MNHLILRVRQNLFMWTHRTSNNMSFYSDILHLNYRMQGSPPSFLCPPFKKYKMMSSVGEVISHLHLTQANSIFGNAIPVSSRSSLSSKDDVKPQAVHGFPAPMCCLASGANSPTKARGKDQLHSASPLPLTCAWPAISMPASRNSSKSSLNFPEAAASSPLWPRVAWTTSPADWFRSAAAWFSSLWASWKGFVLGGNYGKRGHIAGGVLLNVGGVVGTAGRRETLRIHF